jgi:molybdenum cofactor cytidylyltransferase
MTESPTILILAAGSRRRFGAQGQRLAQALGRRTVLGTTIRHAIATGWPVGVVLTTSLVPLATTWVATRDLVVLDDDAAARGIGHAISAGVTAHAAAAGWLLLPGDMPLIRPSTMLAVGRALDHHPAACAQHQGRPGFPQAFAAELFSELVTLPVEEGARRLLARYPAAAVDVDDPGVLIDIEGDDDLAAVRAALAAADESVEAGEDDASLAPARPMPGR